MAEVCTTCGLPKDLCVCGEIEKEQQRIRIRLETRKFGRPTTVIDGMDEKTTDLQEMAHKLKAFCACGGTSKGGQIMLQGDHRDRVTWDVPVHSVADIEALPFAPRMVNLKPSRFGPLRELCAGYDYCAEHGILAYGGG